MSRKERIQEYSAAIIGLIFFIYLIFVILPNSSDGDKNYSGTCRNVTDKTTQQECDLNAQDKARLRD